MYSSPDHHQKTNTVSGCPRHVDIEKELGWDLVLRGTSAESWVKLLAPPKRIEMSSRIPLRGQKPPEKVVSSPKENWKGTQKTFVEEGLKFEDDPSSLILFSERSLAEWFWRLVDGSGAKSQRAKATIRLVLDQLISPHAVGLSTS